MSNSKKIILPESELPRQWYNIVADMPTKPLPLLHPGTKQPVTRELMNRIFVEELVNQEFSTERWTDIPDRVLDIYRIWRCTPLVRASGLEKALDLPSGIRIYFKNESVSPAGSHKPNSAVAQAYYAAEQGLHRMTTETGGGQWGSAMSMAAGMFGLDLRVYMVKVSYNQKPYRKLMMNSWGTDVFPSPSDTTKSGREILAANPGDGGSLGTAISEAVEMVLENPDARYCLGSVLNHVVLHQTIIGEETLRQLEMTGDYPDVVIGCFGGGSNFGGIAYPFLRENLTRGRTTRLVAAEPASCPKLTRGEFQYDFGDVAGFTPLIPMFTLGHDFHPADIHAGGLRYHGAGTTASQLLRDGLFEAVDIEQVESLAAGVVFARSEGIIPAPESTHAICAAIREAEKAREAGEARTIVFNLSGHGIVDLYAYEQYLAGALKNCTLSDAEIAKSVSRLEKLI